MQARNLVGAAMVLIGWVGAATAQSAAELASATLTGSVMDVQSRPIAGARIVIAGASVGTVTDARGNYTLVAAPQPATVVVNAAGFKPFEVSGIRLNARQTSTYNFRLELATAPQPDISTDPDLEPAKYLHGPSPVYPPEKQAAKIAGSVTLRFVVNTSGEVDSNTIQVLNASDTAFVASAISTIARSTFVPAKLRGQPVRQMATQTVRFVPKD